MDEQRPLRIVLAKVGLDGHDRGIKVVGRGLKDAGFQVTYAGLWQTPEAIVRAVIESDADWLGVSVLNGAHMTLVSQVREAMLEAGLQHVGVLVGGIIPEADGRALLEMGITRICGPGTPLPSIVEFLHTSGKRTHEA